jgi:hypothetical protein
MTMASDPVGEDGGAIPGSWNKGGVKSEAKRFEGRGKAGAAKAYGKHAKEGNTPELDQSWDSVSGNPKPLPKDPAHRG